jgi:succinate-acetate transporter protein
VPTRSDAVTGDRIGSPLPLSLSGLALASIAFTAVELGWVGSSQRSVMALAVLVFSVPLQFAASMLALTAGDTAAGTGAGILAGSWAATTVITLFARGSSSRHAGLGVVLLAAAALLLISAIAAGGKAVVALVLALAAARFAITGVFELTGLTGWQTASGWLGLVVALVAWYCVAAVELQGSYDREVLPIRLRRGRSSASSTVSR